jgi:hypothetical protein
MANEFGMSAMEYYYHTIGRIVGYLSNRDGGASISINHSRYNPAKARSRL